MEELEKSILEVAQYRPEIIEKLVQFSVTDTLMFWGSEKDLIAQQQKTWDPILKWCAASLDAKIDVTSSLDVPISNKETGYRLKNFLYAMSDRELTAFYKSALLMKSVMLAMALTKGFLSAEQAFEASHLEELWQNQIWGTTEDADVARNNIKQELIAIENFLKNK